MSKTTVSLGTTQFVRDRCLCFAAQRAARRLARRFDEVLRPLDLTNGQFSLLMSLNRPEPATIGEIAAFLVMDRTTLTANLKPLERRGLMKTVVDHTDRRMRRLLLTKDGHKLLEAAMPVWKRTHVETERSLVGIDAASVRAGLEAIA